MNQPNTPPPGDEDPEIEATVERAVSRVSAILAPKSHAMQREILAGMCAQLALEAHARGESDHAAELEQLGLQALGKQPS